MRAIGCLKSNVVVRRVSRSYVCVRAFLFCVASGGSWLCGGRMVFRFLLADFGEVKGMRIMNLAEGLVAGLQALVLKMALARAVMISL